MQAVERSFSDFLRHPKEVVAELAGSRILRSGPIEIARGGLVVLLLG